MGGESGRSYKRGVAHEPREHWRWATLISQFAKDFSIGVMGKGLGITADNWSNYLPLTAPDTNMYLMEQQENRYIFFW